MEIISKETGRELTLTLRGELDHHGAKNVMQRMELALDAALPLGRELYGFVGDRGRDARTEADAGARRRRSAAARSAAGKACVRHSGHFPHHPA